MPNQNSAVKKLREKLFDISYSTKSKNKKITLSSDKLAKKAREVRKTFKDEDLARFNFNQ